MDRFRKIHFIERKATWRIFMVREETHEETTSRPHNVWPDLWKHMSDAAKSKAKQKWAIEKPKLENARRLRGIFFIEPNVRRKLENPMPAAMPAATLGNTRQVCFCCRCPLVYENTIGRCTAQVSGGSHCCKRNKFIEALQFGTYRVFRLSRTLPKE